MANSTADEQAEHPGLELPRRGIGVHAVRQDEEVVLEVVHLRAVAAADAVLDRQWVEMEHVREEGDLVLAAGGEVDPDDAIAALEQPRKIGGGVPLAQSFLGAPGDDGDHAPSRVGAES
jgi:hypothetical protein